MRLRLTAKHIAMVVYGLRALFLGKKGVLLCFTSAW